MHLLAQTLLNRLIFNLHGETLKIVVVVNPRIFFYTVTQKIQEVCLQGDQKRISVSRVTKKRISVSRVTKKRISVYRTKLPLSGSLDYPSLNSKPCTRK